MCLGFVAEYVAPELVLCRRSNVGHAVDLWCFGVLMYEMYTGFPLFCGNSNFPAHVYAQVVSYKEKYCRGYCEHMPEDLREVVCSLLRTPEKRNSISELKKMRFFS